MEKLYALRVDYSKTLEQMIAEARFDYVNSGISSEHFLINGEGIQEKIAEIVLFPGMMTTAEVVYDIRRRGLLPAGIEDLVAFASEYPDFQRIGNPVIALGTSWKRAEGEEVVPVLRGGEKDRNMHLLRTVNNWNPSERFLALRQ